MRKVKKELNKYNEFLKSYKFKYYEIEETDDVVMWNNHIIDNKEGSVISEGEDFINVGYKLKGAMPKLLSNLFPYGFIFKGKKVNSIESVFQGLKFPNKKMQNLVLNYSGADSNNVKIATNYDWKVTGFLYWQGKPIKRDSDEYAQFINELYISAIQNPLYRQVLKSVKNKYILHSIGETNKDKTVFTRYEFEKQLNSLVKFLN